MTGITGIGTDILVERVGGHLPSEVYDNALTRRVVRQRLLTRPALKREARSSGNYFEYGTREVVECPEPPGAGPLPERLRIKLGRHKIPRPFVAEVPDVQLVGPNAMPITQSNEIVFENLLGSVRRAVITHLRTIALGDLPVYRSAAADTLDHAVSLVGPWCHEYHHWLSDYLTRLRGVERYVERTGKAPTVIVPSGMPSWMSESLRLAGVPEADRYEWTGGRLNVRRLVVPSLPRITELTHPGDRYKGYVFSPDAYRWLGRSFRSHAQGVPQAVDLSTDIYVSRTDAPVRRVLNEGELMKTLAEQGFQRYVLSKYDFVDQVRLFASAERVVGPMGAGLTNILSSQDTALVTLFGSDHNACYFTQAAGLGFSFGYVRGTPVDGDMTVCPEAVHRVLQQLE